MKRTFALISAAALLALSGCASREAGTAPESIAPAVSGGSYESGFNSAPEETDPADTHEAVTFVPETDAVSEEPHAATEITTAQTSSQTEEQITATQTTTATSATNVTTATTAMTTAQTTKATTAQTPAPEPAEEIDPYAVAAEKRRDLLPEIDVPVYSHTHAGDYVLLTVIPEKIYWNELKDFQPTEGEPFTLLFPAVFYDVFKESDSVLLNFPDFNYTEYGDLEGLEGVTADFMYLQYTPYQDQWQAGLLYPIKDGILTELDCIDRVDKYYAHDRFCGYYDFDVLMDDEEGEGFPDEFYYGMTVDEVDRFMAEKHAECAEAQARADAEEEAGLIVCELFSLGHDFMIYGAEMRLSLVE